jgi:hypothetical protein
LKNPRARCNGWARPSLWGIAVLYCLSTGFHHSPILFGLVELLSVPLVWRILAGTCKVVLLQLIT